LTGKYDHQINKYRHRFFEEKFKNLNINFPEGPYLVKISEAKIIKMNQLNSMFQFHKSHSTRAIQQLADNGFILKEIDPEDQRGYILSITPEGSDMAMKVIQVLNEWETLITSVISEEEKVVIENIQKKIYIKVLEYFEEDQLDEKNL
jgi:DNA-binding MarR family transcriptional regulator